MGASGDNLREYLKMIACVWPANRSAEGAQVGGGRGIRTLETREGLAVFKTATFNHSVIPPEDTLPQIAKNTIHPF